MKEYNYLISQKTVKLLSRTVQNFNLVNMNSEVKCSAVAGSNTMFKFLDFIKKA